MSSDPIGDMLAVIRNANAKFHERVDVPASGVKKEIARVLKEEGYVSDYKQLTDRKQGVLRVVLKYLPNKTRALQGIKRVSRPGLRVYRQWDALPKVRGGLGMSLISTSKGILSDLQARKQRVGGEVLALVW
jgi:small subunit ribosomal protein S8